MHKVYSVDRKQKNIIREFPMSLDRVFILVLTFSFDLKEEEENFPMPGYLILNYSTSARCI